MSSVSAAELWNPSEGLECSSSSGSRTLIFRGSASVYSPLEVCRLNVGVHFVINTPLYSRPKAGDHA